MKPAAVLLAATLSTPAAAEPVSPWVVDGAARLRLVDAGRGPSGERLAGVAIRLEPGWKTYWRQPGDSGVPPRLDFSGSTNVAAVTVAFPTPERQSDAGGTVNVYHGEVVLPLTVQPVDPGAPVSLALVADYGACAQVCVPSHAKAALLLDAEGGFQGPAAAAVRRAAAMTPKATPLGVRAGALAVSSVRRMTGRTEVEVEVEAPDQQAAVLFAETGGGDYVAAPEPAGAGAGGRARFRIGFAGGGLPASGLRLTLAAGGAAIETLVPLDAITPEP